MLLIISFVFLVLSLLCIILIDKLNTKKLRILRNIFAAISIIFAISMFGSLISQPFIPTQYSDSVFQSSRELTPISDDESVYVLTSNGNYTYEITYPTSKGPVEESITISSYFCTIIKEENCTTPRIEKYISEPQITFWKIGRTPKTEYIIYVPKGTVSN